MGCSKHLINGIVSLVISVGFTVAFADEGDEYSLSDVALSVARPDGLFSLLNVDVAVEERDRLIYLSSVNPSVRPAEIEAID